MTSTQGPKRRSGMAPSASAARALLRRPLLFLAALAALLPALPALAQERPAPVLKPRILAERPHDPAAFTQGLVFQDGLLYESTGKYGRSSLRAVARESGAVLKRVELDDAYFAEGLAAWGPSLIQMTWKEEVAFVYDRPSLRRTRTIPRRGEAWGLASDGARLILSDGSSRLRFLDPESLAETGSVDVSDGGTPLTELNELEWAGGRIYANIWWQDRLAVIDAKSGQVLAYIDIEPLRSRLGNKHGAEAANGIAYDPGQNRLLVTGKFWDKLFELALPDLPLAAP